MDKTEQFDLEGYRNLSFWNKHDADAVVSFDRIFLPTTIGGSVISLVRDSSSFVFVYPGVLLLLTLWFMLSLRYRERIKQRFDSMKDIEQKLGFSAHSTLTDSGMKRPRDDNV